MGKKASAVGKAIAVAALCGAAAVCNIAAGADAPAADSKAQAPAPTGQDEIIVTGNLGELRRKLRLAEEAVFARFNDINSDDRFDIHCLTEAPLGTRIPQRSCQSNSWRAEDSNFAQATIAELRGELGSNPYMFRANQQIMQDRLREEMLRLASQDPQLGDAVTELRQAQQAFAQETGTLRDLTMVRQLPTESAGLPFGAQRVFEVHIGRDPWNLGLKQRSFTLADVTGEIRKLDLLCKEGNAHLKYEAGVDWTAPAGWTECMLRVRAKRASTFTFYEFAPSESSNDASATHSANVEHRE